MNQEIISSQSINKELAYLLGVYLTDGSISKENKFQLQVIDKDFAENVLACIKKIKPSCQANIYQRDATKNGGWNKSIQYCINAGFIDWKDFFVKQTGEKHFIPTVILESSLTIKKWFIAGVMDGDGFIAKHTDYKKNRVQYTIGIGKVEKGWIMEFNKMLQSIGVNTYKPYRSVTKGGVPFITFNINKEDFINNGLFFTIKRKQDKLCLLKSFMKVQRLNAADPIKDQDIVQSIT